MGHHHSHADRDLPDRHDSHADRDGQSGHASGHQSGHASSHQSSHQSGHASGHQSGHHSHAGHSHAGHSHGGAFSSDLGAAALSSTSPLAAQRRRSVRRVLVGTLVLNVIVVILKAIVGWWTGSLSLMADALHSVTDSLNNVLGLVTNRLSSPEPDWDHPYGHQKFEAIGALGIAAFLGIACFEVLKGAAERILGGVKPIDVGSVDLAILLLVLGINIFVAFYERAVGQRLQSPILIADAHHTMSDIWITLSVLAGLLGIWVFNWPWLDVFMAFPVALLVLKSSWAVLRDNLPWLVDEAAIAPEAIHQVVMAVPGVTNCHQIASRGLLGRQVFIDMHLIVAATDVQTAHEITEAVEAQLMERYGPVRVTIHVEPPAYHEDQITYQS